MIILERALLVIGKEAPQMTCQKVQKVDTGSFRPPMRYI